LRVAVAGHKPVRASAALHQAVTLLHPLLHATRYLEDAGQMSYVVAYLAMTAPSGPTRTG
jgi:hypothetical protein